MFSGGRWRGRCVLAGRVKVRRTIWCGLIADCDHWAPFVDGRMFRLFEWYINEITVCVRLVRRAIVVFLGFIFTNVIVRYTGRIGGDGVGFLLAATAAQRKSKPRETR